MIISHAYIFPQNKVLIYDNICCSLLIFSFLAMLVPFWLWWLLTASSFYDFNGYSSLLLSTYPPFWLWWLLPPPPFKINHLSDFDGYSSLLLSNYPPFSAWWLLRPPPFWPWWILFHPPFWPWWLLPLPFFLILIVTPSYSFLTFIMATPCSSFLTLMAAPSSSFLTLMAAPFLLLSGCHGFSVFSFLTFKSLVVLDIQVLLFPPHPSISSFHFFQLWPQRFLHSPTCQE